jgi:general L-amino acid transport system substrate-binding protein
LSTIRVLLLAFAAGFIAAAPTRAGTLDQVQKRDQLVCGVNPGLAGFAIADAQGNWTGLDVDICRAIAAAVLGDARKVRFVPLNTQERFTALKAGIVDVMSRNTTWTLSRDLSLGVGFTAVTFYDGQGFLVPKSLKAKRALDLNGASVCLQGGTTTQFNLVDFARSQKIILKAAIFPAMAEAKAAFFRGGRCQAFSSDGSQLASVRAYDAPRSDDYEILPDLISREPLGPAVRRGDESWLSIVKWTIYALILAEEKHIARTPVYAKDGIAVSKTVEEAKRDNDPDIQKLIGVNGDIGKMMDLPNDWAARAIAQVGNYGEIFERNVGPKTPLKLQRGLNALWTDGGLMYGMPIR